MAKADLIMEVVALATELGEAVETEGLKVEELEKLLEELQAKKAGPDSAAADKAAAEGAKRGPKAPYTVEDGKSITSARGILGGGEGVYLKDLAGGQGSVDALVKSGHLKKA